MPCVSMEREEKTQSEYTYSSYPEMNYQVSVGKLPTWALALPMKLDDSISHSMWRPANKIYDNNAKALSLSKKAIKVSVYEAG